MMINCSCNDMQIQISNMNVMVSCHSEDLPFNQSQESLRRMAFNELGTRRVLNLIFLRVRYSGYIHKVLLE